MKCSLVLAALVAVLAVASAQKRIVCYYGSWAVYRPEEGKFDVEQIDPTLCTHVIYTFVGISQEGEVKVLDAWNDLPDNYGKGAFGRFIKLKKLSPGTKFMIAIGGWNEGSTKYSEVMSNPGLRQKFVQNVIAFLKKYEFDGFDVDWEYPNQRGGKPEDKENYSLLLEELRAAFDPLGYVLSAATGAGTQSINGSYDVPRISKALHMINFMTYDLHGTWESFTGQNAPMYKSAADTSPLQATLNVDYLLQNFINHGAERSKINLGMATYGHCFAVQNADTAPIGSASNGPGMAGPYTRQAGTLGYNEICVNVKSGGWKYHWDDVQKVPYATKDNQWAGYDDVRSIEIKCNYALSEQLGGAMIWSVETDDFHGKCGEGKNPLLTKINQVLNGGVPPPTPPTTTPDPTAPTTTSAPTESTTEEPTAAPTTVGPHTDHPEKLCTEDGGYVRDPLNCRIFYLCSKATGSFQATMFECGEGEGFDTVNKVCDYAEKVGC